MLPCQVLVHTGAGLQVLGVPVVRGLVLAAQIQQDGHTGRHSRSEREVQVTFQLLHRGQALGGAGPCFWHVFPQLLWVQYFSISMTWIKNVRLREVR